MTGATNGAAIRSGIVTLQAAADAFLSSPRCENPNTRRAYGGVVDKVIGELGALRQLAEVTEAEIGEVLEGLWRTAGESTWNRNRAAVSSWLTWCRDKQRWPAPTVPGSCERRKEHVDATKDLPKATIERQISRRNVPLREKTLWRMLYETAARANEVLALNVEALDLDNCRAPIRSKGGETEWVYWGTGTAHLLPRLLRLPDGSSRTSGPLFLSSRRPVPAPDNADGAGNGIGIQAGFLVTPVTQDLVQGNQVRRNYRVGVLVLFAFNNRILNNTTEDNGLIDLLDTAFEVVEEECDSNVWFGNSWGQPSGALFPLGIFTSYFPDCTATGGTGPNPPAMASPALASTTPSTASIAPSLLGEGEASQPRRSAPAR